VSADDKDPSNNTGSDSKVVTIANVNLPLQLVAGATASCGTSNSLTINFSDPAGTNDTYSATIDWGDGNSDIPSPISSGDSFNHTYTLAGKYTATVTVSDEDGGTSDSKTVELALNYNLSGILQPVNPGPPNSIFKFGSTIPVKVKIQDCDGSYPANLGPKVTWQLLTSGTPSGDVSEPYSTSAADTGTQCGLPVHQTTNTSLIWPQSHSQMERLHTAFM